MVNSSEISTLQTSSEIICMIEWGYGRLTENGVKRNYKTVIMLEELYKLEKVFIQNVKSCLENIEIFSLIKWRRVLYLMEYFDLEYIKTHMRKIFINKVNVLKYLDYTVARESAASSSDSLYEYIVSNKYEKYLNKDEIINAIIECRESGEIFSLPKDIQYNSVAFFIKEDQQKLNRHNFVDEEDVYELIEQWKKEYEENNKLLTE